MSSLKVNPSVRPSQEQGLSAVSLRLPPSPLSASLSWPIWHRGLLRKALRARQRAIHLRLTEPLNSPEATRCNDREMFEFRGVAALCLLNVRA